MSIVIPESELPTDLTEQQAVEAAYGSELAAVADRLNRGLPSLIECDKELAPWLFQGLRARLKTLGIRCFYLDGRQRQEEQQGPIPLGLIGAMIAQLREVVRGAVDAGATDERRVVVLPHLDLLTTSQGGLTAEAREVIPLLYENPHLVWLGFKDPSFSLPRVIENLFPHRTSVLGIARARLRHLITRAEARKFGHGFNPWALYKFVSGVNAYRLRRLLSTLEGEDYPADPSKAYRQLRQATLSDTLEVPEIDLDRDIGGYATVKKQLRSEIVDILARKDALGDADAIARLEELIPKGMIFWGPPGTGKTLFAKAMAASLGAAITIVSGPELKSKWVGESEDNLRQIFHKARQSAPSIIVFDELDSFASARGTYTGSGVEHSMVNQLLTEMDGFHKDEMVFVIGTTNFAEALDPALLRPGRFEFHLHVPYPDDDDRRAILQIYDQKMTLRMSPEALDYAVRRTGRGYATPAGTPFSGDHLNAMCRAVARLRFRDDRSDATTPEDVERGLTEYEERRELRPSEEKMLATHESGHALVAMFCPRYPPVERITIRSEMSWAPGYVSYQHEESIGQTRDELLEDLAVLLGGIEAERLLLGDVSTGAAGGDLVRATHTARAMVEISGMGGAVTGLRQYSHLDADFRLRRSPELSESQRALLDQEVNRLINEAQSRAAAILKENRPLLETLRAMLLEKKTLDAKALSSVARKKEEKNG